MPNPDVIAKVRQLHESLADARPDHPAVGAVAQHLDTVMGEPAHAPHYTGLREKLEAASVAVEVDHPTVASAMKGVVQSLLAAGL